MKTRTFLILFCLFTAPFANAESDKDYTKRKLAEVVTPLTNQVQKLQKRVKEIDQSVEDYVEQQDERIKQLENNVSNLAAQLSELRSWREEKWNAGQNAVKKTDQKTEKGNGESSYSLWLLFPVVAVVVGILGFAIWPRKTVGTSPPPVPDHPKCPRCGWEHDPSDTVCKNPNCKVQF